MPIKIEKLAGEPIIIATYSGRVTADELKDMFDQSHALAAGISGYIYRISDLSQLTVSFEELQQLNHQASAEIPGSTSDPNMVVVFVGRNEWIELLQKDEVFQKEFDEMDVPIFDDLKDALTAIRQMIRASE